MLNEMLTQWTTSPLVSKSLGRPMKEDADNWDETDVPGYLIGFGSIVILVVLFITGFVIGMKSGFDRPGLGRVLIGLYIIYWGFLFL